jgi:hypothetical protein
LNRIPAGFADGLGQFLARHLLWRLRPSHDLLTEEQYRELQKIGEFDTKTSS